MKIALDDEKLFGNDAAEDEDEQVLMSYFVNQPDFDKFLDPKHKLRIANGRKGTGKSALLKRFAHLVRGSPGQPPQSIVVAVVPSRLVALKEPPATENHTILENYWKQVICGAINMALADEIGFAWTDNQMALVDSAEVAGFSGRNLVGSLLSRLIGKVNLGGVLEVTPTPRPTANHEQLLQRIARENGLRRPVWFLLDDIDAKFQNSPAQQVFISSFFSACRNLVNETTGIGIRATVRTDVWTSLTSAEDSDKVDQYLTKIVWSATQQKTMLANRMLAYAKRNEPDSKEAHWKLAEHENELIECAFVARMKWGGATAPAEHVLRVLAGGRPRWIAQLCRMAGVNATKEQKDRIGIHHVTQAMGEFGRRRLADLYREHHHQFTDLRRVVEAFAGGPRRYSTAELTLRIASEYEARTELKNIPPVDGVPYRDTLQIARFLYKCGFINGNNAGKATLAVPEFVTFDMRSDLLKVDTNLDDGMNWELQPAYRNILNVS